MADDKQEESKKQGIEYLIEQGYKKISTKTFISDLELESFLNKDFANINKTRALGFIQILEREYPVDLTSLKDAYLEYELSHKRAEPETLFVEKPMARDKEWLSFWPYLLAGFVVIGLLFIFFTGDAKEGEVVETAPIAQHIEENKSVINKAVENVAKLEEHKSEPVQNVPILEQSADEANVAKVVVNSTDSDAKNLDLDLDKVVLEMIKERNISVEEHNISLDDNITQTALKPVELKKSTAVIAKAEAKKEVVKKEITRGDIYIQPSKKAWVGVIYLDDLTKKDFLIRKKLPLNSKRDQLIVIGHKHFKLYNKNYSIKFRGKGPVRFIYKDGEVMEINKKEFDRTSKGAAW